MEFLKDAAYTIDRDLKEFQMLLLIHDEVMGECREDAAEKVLASATEMMHSSCGEVAITAKGVVGDSWGSLK